MVISGVQSSRDVSVSKYFSGEKLDNQTWILRIHKNPDAVVPAAIPALLWQDERERQRIDIG